MQVVQVDAQLKPARLLWYCIDGSAVGHGPAATPDQLARSASLVMVIQHRAEAASMWVRCGHREPYEQLVQVVHVDAQLKPARLLWYCIDGGAVGHGPAATPDQLARSASLVMVIQHQAEERQLRGYDARASRAVCCVDRRCTSMRS